MSDQESLKAALETAISSPKVSGVITALTGSSGAAAIFGQVNTIFGAISLLISCVVGLYTIRILRLKGRILERMEKNGESLKD
jgi:hypothetical protein